MPIESMTDARKIAAALAIPLLLAAAPAQARQDAMSLISQGHAAFNQAMDLDTQAKADYIAGRYGKACDGFHAAATGEGEAEGLLRQAESQMDGDGDRKIISEIQGIEETQRDENKLSAVACKAAEDAGR